MSTRHAVSSGFRNYEMCRMWNCFSVVWLYLSNKPDWSSEWAGEWLSRRVAGCVEEWLSEWLIKGIWYPSGGACLGVAEWSNQSVRQSGMKRAEIIEVLLSAHQFAINTLRGISTSGFSATELNINHFVSVSLCCIRHSASMYLLLRQATK
jgi:hypothetical protein